MTDVFDAIEYKSYLPGAPPPPRRRSFPAVPAPTLPSEQSVGYMGDMTMNGAPRGPMVMNASRKRSYNDRGDTDGFNGAGHQFGGDMNERSYKQPRRGNNMGSGGRYDSYGNGRGGRPNQSTPLPTNPSQFPSLPQLPSPPPGMPPFDPNNPMAALLAMQAMGFPVPGVPSFPQASSAIGQSWSPAGGFPPKPKRAQRCRDYDTKGFCARGNTCLYEHGADSIFVPPPQVDGKSMFRMTTLTFNELPPLW